MQIEELYQLTQWLNTEIIKSQIIQKFDALINVINANVRKQPNQPMQPFNSQKTELIQALSNVKLSKLTLKQIETLSVLKIKENIGEKGINKIDKIFSNQLDIAHVLQEITNMKKELQDGVNKLSAITKPILPFLKQELNELPSEYVLTRIIFEHDAAVDNIVKLKKWSDNWHNIGRGFAIANGQKPEDIQVIGGDKGSLIIELAILATLAVPIAKAINITLDSLVKYREFQLKSYEVRQLKEKHPTMSEELEEDAKKWEERAERLKKQISEEVFSKIIEHCSDYKTACKNELEKSVNLLVNFLSQGGDVDCLIQEDSENDDLQEDITETKRTLQHEFSEIRLLKQTLLLESEENKKEKL